MRAQPRFSHAFFPLRMSGVLTSISIAETRSVLVSPAVDSEAYQELYARKAYICTDESMQCHAEDNPSNRSSGQSNGVARGMAKRGM